MVSSDNDGLWTAIYVAAESFRYKVTGEADARVCARQGMSALMRLEAITGIPGFPARSFIKVGPPGEGVTRAPTRSSGTSLRTLREIPMDLVEWTVRSSHRLDVAVDPLSDRFQRRQALIVLPYDELPMTKWNGNPYSLDGCKGGQGEDDGAYLHLPY